MVINSYRPNNGKVSIRLPGNTTRGSSISRARSAIGILIRATLMSEGFGLMLNTRITMLHTQATKQGALTSPISTVLTTRRPHSSVQGLKHLCVRARYHPPLPICLAVRLSVHIPKHAAVDSYRRFVDTCHAVPTPMSTPIISETTSCVLCAKLVPVANWTCTHAYVPYNIGRHPVREPLSKNEGRFQSLMPRNHCGT